MKTKKLILSALLFTGVLSSCVKHEVIPAPQPLVELKTYFTGIINGTDVEFTDDVDGFNGETTQAQYIFPAPALSSVVYYCDMNSNLIETSIKVGIGSLDWDAAAIEKPSLTQFNDYFTGLKTPNVVNFSNGALDGVEITYRDAFGNTWVSDENSVNLQEVKFIDVKNESDNTGDFSKVTVEFSCHVYRTVGLEKDSVRIDNGHFEGWFQR